MTTLAAEIEATRAELEELKKIREQTKLDRLFDDIKLGGIVAAVFFALGYFLGTQNQ